MRMSGLCKRSRNFCLSAALSAPRRYLIVKKYQTQNQSSHANAVIAIRGIPKRVRKLGLPQSPHNHFQKSVNAPIAIPILPPSSTLLRERCHPEGIRRGCLKDLSVHSCDNRYTESGFCELSKILLIVCTLYGINDCCTMM